MTCKKQAPEDMDFIADLVGAKDDSLDKPIIYKPSAKTNGYGINARDMYNLVFGAGSSAVLDKNGVPFGVTDVSKHPWSKGPVITFDEHKTLQNKKTAALNELSNQGLYNLTQKSYPLRHEAPKRFLKDAISIFPDDGACTTSSC